MRLEYFGIRVKSMEESIKFYTKGLGMALVAEPKKFPPTGGFYAYVKSPSSPQIIELNWYPKSYVKGYKKGDELDHLGFTLKRGEDMDVVMKRLVELGGKVKIPPYISGRTKLGFVEDPNGVWIELLERVRRK